MSKDTNATPAALAALLQSPEVLARFGEFLAAQVGVGTAKPFVSDLWARYERHGTTPVGDGRMRIKSWNGTAKYYARPLLKFFGGKVWDEVTHELADEYRRWRRETISNRGKPVCHATVNRELMSMLGCFSHAVKKNLIPRNPLKGMPREVETHDRAFTITIDQLKSILQHSRPWLRSYLMLLFETGCRRNEIRYLEWTWVDLDRGFITIPKERAKNRRERMIPLSTVARMILDGMPRDPMSPFVFPNPLGPTGAIGKTTLWRWFRTACEAAGVAGPTNQPVWLHTLRHTWATDFVTRGGDVYTMMSIGGWTDPSVVQRYVNIAARHKDAAKELLDERSASLLPAVRKGPQRVVTSSEVRGAVAARVAKK